MNLFLEKNKDFFNIGIFNPIESEEINNYINELTTKYASGIKLHSRDIVRLPYTLVGYNESNKNEFDLRIALIGEGIRYGILIMNQIVENSKWTKVSVQLPKDDCETRLYDRVKKEYHYSTFKNGCFISGYFGSTPIYFNIDKIKDWYWTLIHDFE